MQILKCSGRDPVSGATTPHSVVCTSMHGYQIDDIFEYSAVALDS